MTKHQNFIVLDYLRIQISKNKASIKITKLEPGRGFEPRSQKAEAFEATVIPLDYPGLRNHPE